MALFLAIIASVLLLPAHSLGKKSHACTERRNLIPSDRTYTCRSNATINRIIGVLIRLWEIWSGPILVRLRLRLQDDGLNRRRKSGVASSLFIFSVLAFRWAFSGGNLRAYGDAKVCAIRLGMHARRLGSRPKLPGSPPTNWCIQNFKEVITDPSLFSNTICTYPVHFAKRL